MRDRVKLIVNNREIKKRYLGNRLVWEAIRLLYTFRKDMSLNVIYNSTKQGHGFAFQSDLELNKHIEKTRKLVFRKFNQVRIELEVESVLKSNNIIYIYLSQSEYTRARSSLESYIKGYSYEVDLYGS